MSRLNHVGVRESTLSKARDLGNDMVRDPVIRPHLKCVAQYQSYHRFRIAHRAHWEQSTRFERYYQERLFALADKESGQGLSEACDSINNWDVWYHQVVHPIKTVLWETWERAVNLERRYFEALLDSGEATPDQIQTIIDNEELEPHKTVPMRLVAQSANDGAVPSILRFLHLARRSA